MVPFHYGASFYDVFVAPSPNFYSSGRAFLLNDNDASGLDKSVQVDRWWRERLYAMNEEIDMESPHLTNSLFLIGRRSLIATSSAWTPSLDARAFTITWPID